jgi:lipoyl(octanoyl) transferase
MLSSSIKPAALSTRPVSEVEWIIDRTPVSYDAAMRKMGARVEAIAEGGAAECVWLLEHPAVYTAGTSARADELLDPLRFPVVRTGRGGRFTYHGPGQRVAYAMLNLSARGRDVRAYVRALEDWLIAALDRLGVTAERRPGQIGLFVEGAKIASIGVRVQRWVTSHGVSLNVAPELEHFAGIVPCGLDGAAMTSLAALGAETDMETIDQALCESFRLVFRREED